MPEEDPFTREKSEPPFLEQVMDRRYFLSAAALLPGVLGFAHGIFTMNEPTREKAKTATDLIPNAAIATNQLAIVSRMAKKSLDPVLRPRINVERIWEEGGSLHLIGVDPREAEWEKDKQLLEQAMETAAVVCTSQARHIERKNMRKYFLEIEKSAEAQKKRVMAIGPNDVALSAFSLLSTLLAQANIVKSIFQTTVSNSPIDAMNDVVCTTAYGMGGVIYPIRVHVGYNDSQIVQMVATVRDIARNRKERVLFIINQDRAPDAAFYVQNPQAMAWKEALYQRTYWALERNER